MAELSLEFAGLEFKNPVIAPAGPLGRTFHALRNSIEAGVGAVTLKSSNAKPPREIVPKPGCHVHPKPAHLFLRKYGMPTTMVNWEGVPVEFTAEKQAEMIERIKPVADDHGTRIIANLHPDPMYAEDLEMLRHDIRTILSAGPDMLELCPCPYHFPAARSSPGQTIPPEVIALIKQVFPLVKQEADVPIIAKFNGMIFTNASDVFKEIGVTTLHVAEGPLVCGTIVDIEEMKPLVPGPAVMMYGTLRRPLLNLACARTKDLGGFDLISSGGVWTANDCIERIMCGATLVGIHTAVQYHGHKLYGRIIDGISEFLDRKGVAIDDIIGTAVPQIVDLDLHEEFMRECDVPNEALRPVIDLQDCTKCEICANCIHGGISMEGETPTVHLDLCVRCGICESLCPTEAITLQRS